MRVAYETVMRSSAVFVPLLLMGCVGARLSSPVVLDRAVFPDFGVDELGPDYERKDAAIDGVAVFGYIVADSTHAPLDGGYGHTILGDDSGGGLITQAGRYFFLAPSGTHVLFAHRLGYGSDSALIVVDSVPVRADFVLKATGVVLNH